MTKAKMIGMLPKGTGGSYLDQARRVYDNGQSAPTLMTREGGVVGWMCENRARQVADLNYFKHEQSNRIYSPEAASPTIETKGTDDARSVKITADNGGGNVDNLRIRKLTPRECFRLMGVKDDDVDKLAELSNSTQYHLAGDSIVTTVLMAIFGELLEVEWKEKVNSLHRLNNDGRKE